MKYLVLFAFFFATVPAVTASQKIRLGPLSAVHKAVIRPPSPEELADADSRTLEGAGYIAIAGHRYFELHQHAHFKDCLRERTKDIKPPRTYKFVVAIGTDGRAGEVSANRADPIAECIREKLSDESWTKPPFAPFHFEVWVFIDDCCCPNGA